MLVTVIGSTGVLGRRVVRVLLDRGHQVRALARSRQAAGRLPAGTAVVGDVWDEGFLRVSLAGSDAVMMLATAIPKGPGAILPRAWRTNDRVRSRLAPTVARIARQSGVSALVQESVLLVYGDSGERWVTEATAVDPAVQARSCLTAEVAAREFQSVVPGRRAAILRFAMFAAPESGLARQTWQMATKGSAPVLGDLDGYVTFVHAQDAATAAVHALGVPAGTYNVGAEPLTGSAWMASMSRLVGREVHPPPAVLRAVLPKASPIARSLTRSIRLDSSALKATGWSPEYPTAEAVWGAVGSGRG